MFKRFLAWLFKPAPVRSLHVNEAASPQRERVNLTYRVNAAQVRRGVEEDGRKYTVIPSYTLPDEVVMNGLLYTHAEIEKSYAGLEGTLAPLGHPVVNGTFVSALDARAINTHHIGAFNRNVERRGNRIYAEKWVDEQYAGNTEGGKKLFEALDKGEPIHTSTGIFLTVDLATNGKAADGTPYRGAARNMLMDHDAILIGEIGAATPEQGVGLMVNTARVEDAHPLTANQVLSDLSWGRMNQLLSEAAQQKWGAGEGKFAWIEDFDSTTAIVHRDTGASAVNYSIKDGKVVWADSEKPVERKIDWVTQSPIVNRLLQSLGIRVNSEPANPKTVEGYPEMTPEELAAALTANNEKMLAAVKTLVDPVAAAVTQLQANHDALANTLTANARAAETEKRSAVAEKIGQAAADLLTGNALDEAHAALVGAAPILPGLQNNGAKDGYQTTKLPE